MKEGREIKQKDELNKWRKSIHNHEQGLQNLKTEHWCLACKFRPNPLVRALEDLMNTSRHVESKFFNRLKEISEGSQSLIPFKEIHFSDDCWVSKIPFVIRDYLTIWENGKCPTEGEMGKCAFKVKLHDGAKVCLFQNYNERVDILTRFNRSCSIGRRGNTRMPFVHDGHIHRLRGFSK